MSLAIKILAPVIILLGLWILYSILIDRGLEEPTYEVTETKGPIELRRYESHLIASTTVGEGSTISAFRILAAYIFGNNQGSTKLAMTIPVEMTKNIGQNIAMTAPVERSRAGDYAALSFTGFASASKVARLETKLTELLALHDIETSGPVTLLQYDRPGKFPYFRRNELRVKIGQ